MALGWVVFLLFAGCSVALNNTQGSMVSQRCMENTNTFLWEINQAKPKEYAVLMYDAFGKMGSNVEGGNINRPGMVRECRSAHSPTFSGQYCQVFLQQGTVEYFVGICVPDSCGVEDVRMLVLYGKLKFGQMSLIPPLPSILADQSTDQEVIMTHCLPDNIAPDATGVICLFVVCVMVAVPLAATLFTAIIRWQRSRQVSPAAESSSLNTSLNLYGTIMTNGSTSREIENSTSEENTNNSTSNTPLCFPQGCVYQFLQAFSLQTTCHGVLSTSSSISGGGYSSLNGIRVLSLFWIICGHSAQFPAQSNLDNVKDWWNAAESNPLFVLGGSGPDFLAVDSFLLLGGLLSAKTLLGSISRAEGKLSPSLVASYLFKRIKRIQPVHLFSMCLYTGLLSLLQLGPYWFTFIDTLMDCKAYWWANLLLVSNILSVNESCIPWAWYLSLDFQCYVTTPLLVYFYRLNRRVFAVVAGGLLLMSTVTSAVITAVMHLPVFLPRSDNYSLHYYVKPYTRYGPFLIGILTGIFLATKKDQLIKQKWQAALGWFCCLSLIAVLVGLPYALKETPAYPSVPHALYQGLHRPLWALALAWIILACEEGYGGFIKSFLSMGFWIPLSNISFACYMTHPIFIFVYNGLVETPIHYTGVNFMYLFFGHVVLTVLVSYVVTVLIEKPYVLLKCGIK